MMTDAEVADQIARADRFIADFREMVAATMVDPRSPCAGAHRRGLQRIADTLDAVPFVTMYNLSNLHAAYRNRMGMTIMSVIEVYLMSAGTGPTLDYESAVAFLAGFEPLVEKARRRMLQ
jgi:hypothetical protein